MFRFYMTTELSNPQYLPEVCIQATVINFTVTMPGLEEQVRRLQGCPCTGQALWSAAGRCPLGKAARGGPGYEEDPDWGEWAMGAGEMRAALGLWVQGRNTDHNPQRILGHTVVAATATAKQQHKQQYS